MPHRWTARSALALLVTLSGCIGSSDAAGPPHVREEGPTPVQITGASPNQSAGVETTGGGDARGRLYRIDPTTGATRLIWSTEGELREPERSPDGSLLAYQGADPQGTPQIFVVGNGRPHQLTDLPGGAVEPTWSPDGSQIAFAGVAGAGEDSDIFVVDADGGDVRVLAQTVGDDRRPDWSPDGSRVVFDTYATIWVASVNEGEAQPLTSGVTLLQGPAHDAAWSPDGRLIAFTRYDPGSINGLLPYAHLWVVRPDGTGERRVNPPFRNRVFELDPSWSPDGNSIAYTDVERGRIGFSDVATRGAIHVASPFVLTDLSWGLAGLIGVRGASPSPPIRIGIDDDRDPFG